MQDIDLKDGAVSAANDNTLALIKSGQSALSKHLENLRRIRDAKPVN